MTCRACMGEAAPGSAFCDSCLAAKDAVAERDRLDRDMRAALAQLATCSHVPAARAGSSTPATDESIGGKRPPGDHGEAIYTRLYGPPFHHPTAEYPGARDNRARAALIREAWDEVKHLRGHGRATVERPTGESAEEFAQRIVRDGRGWPVRDAAVHFRTGEAAVRKARKNGALLVNGVPHNVDPETGEPLMPRGTAKPGRPAKGDDSIERRRQRLIDLTERRGHSVAAAARLVGISRSTAERDLGRRAA